MTISGTLIFNPKSLDSLKSPFFFQCVHTVQGQATVIKGANLLRDCIRMVDSLPPHRIMYPRCFSVNVTPFCVIFCYFLFVFRFLLHKQNFVD